MRINNSTKQIQKKILNYVLNKLQKITGEYEINTTPNVDRQSLKLLSKSRKVGLESQALLKPSLAVSLLDTYLLGIPLLNNDKPAGTVVETQTSFKDTLSGNDLHRTTLLKGILGNNYLLHDLEHASCATDGAPKHISGFLVELLTTSFHRAIDEFFNEFKDKQSSQISKATFLTTRDRSRGTFDNYQPYLDSMTQAYKEILSEKSDIGKLKYEALIGSILHLNYGMKEAFEELTLHGSPTKSKNALVNTENATGFCLTPKALSELAIIHDKGLEKLKKIISNDPVAINQAPQILKEIPDSYWDLIK
jgi:hypothetical protein